MGLTSLMATPLHGPLFSITVMPCKLCKKDMNYMGPSVDKVKTYHAYMCPCCESISCAVMPTCGTGEIEWLDLI